MEFVLSRSRKKDILGIISQMSCKKTKINKTISEDSISLRSKSCSAVDSPRLSSFENVSPAKIDKKNFDNDFIFGKLENRNEYSISCQNSRLSAASIESRFCSKSIRFSDSSESDDDIFEKFLEKQRTSKLNIHFKASLQNSDISDDESESDQLFYYRINNKLMKSNESRLFSRDSRSMQRKHSGITSSNLPASIPSDFLEQSCNKNKISNYKQTPTDIEEFIYSLSTLYLGSQTTTCKQRHPDAEKFLKKFKTNKKELAERLLKLFNENLFSNALPKSLEILWSRRLLKTAGLCKYLRSTTTLSDGSSIQVRTAQIFLSEKVCTNSERVRDTLLHEACHAAVWIINGKNDAHGPLWKFWASKAHQMWPRLPLISVCHAYTIDTRFTYRCTGCGACVNRHSKSIDTERKVCGQCRSKFELLINTPKGRMLRPSLAASLDKRLLPHCTNKSCPSGIVNSVLHTPLSGAKPIIKSFPNHNDAKLLSHSCTFPCSEIDSEFKNLQI